MRNLLLTISLCAASMSMAQTVTHQACEQSIITPKAEGRYLWLPIQDTAHEGRVQIIVNNEQKMIQNVRMAREKVDYYVALDLMPYMGKGRMDVVVQDVPFGSVCFKKLAQNDDENYEFIEERFRPEFHHTLKRGWMNDPNGMFYLDGTWHLYYQFNPYGSMWGNMHWGHSTSTDLIHWTAQPVALVPDAWGTMFSGSCAVDRENTAGFGRGAVIAMYTTSRQTPHGGDVQSQCLAYSTDGGMTFTKYDGNPVLTGDNKDFRDPNFFWNDDIKAWNLILACGQEMRLYSSPDLKTWKEESRFGAELGGHGGVWECPDLVRVPVMANGKATGAHKWVLLCNINPGGPNGGSATQYFIGDFDGHRFTVDDAARYTDGKALWMDYGMDHYATVSFSDAPALNGKAGAEPRHTMIAWMSNWLYANDVPTHQYRSANSICREPYVYLGADRKMYLGSRPSPEYDGCSFEKTVKVKGSCTVKLTNDEGEEFDIIYDQKAMTLTVDRAKSGTTNFSAEFAKPAVAPLHKKLTSLRIFIDNCSVEVFGNDGEVALTSLVFPESRFNKVVKQ